jgi:hypothetical protein
MEVSIKTALLSAQLALLGTTTPQLRAVSIDQKDDWFYVAYVYYTGSPSDEIIDLWNSAVTEGSAYLGGDYHLIGDFIHVESPGALSIKGSYVYLKEGEVVDPCHIFPVSLKNLNTTHLRLAAQNALLGKIPDAVRGIIVDIFEDTPRIWVYVDNENKKENIDLMMRSLESLQNDLSSGVTLQMHYLIVPYPVKIQPPKDVTFFSVYLRCDHIPE